MSRSTHIRDASGCRIAALLGALAIFAAGPSLAAPAPGTDEAVFAAQYDELPDGSPEELGRLYYSTLGVPGIAGWTAEARRRLLDLVTERYKNRLINRPAAVSEERSHRYIEGLSQSKFAQDFPHVVPQTCAQYALTEGSCAPHRGYVRRVLVLEEMLVQSRLSLDAMEVELVGAARPGFSEAMRQGR